LCAIEHVTTRARGARFSTSADATARGDLPVWSIIAKSPEFRHECSKRHPKLFGLVGWKEHPGRTVCTVVYDIEINDWSCRELGLGFPDYIRIDDRHAYDDAFFACDGGLVCYVS
jgi:hypothetical protein